MNLAAIAAFGAALVGAGGGFYLGHRLGASEVEGWIEQAATLEAQVHQMQTDGDARAKRAETAAAKATAELQRVRKEAEAERAKADGIRAEWAAYFGRMRTPAGGGDCEASLAAARADAASTARAFDRLLTTALGVREIAVLNTEQLKQLQDWVREAVR